jgi:murein DD-endopeptidase MepM/ murein hydrolase activator NlpD
LPHRPLEIAAESVDTAGELRMAAVGAAPLALVPRLNALWPTTGEITTYFGEVGPFSPRGHSGLDIATAQGTPVLALDDGAVVEAHWSPNGYGWLIVIAHPAGQETWYAHLARLDVAPGDQVTRGQQIAAVGSTGYSTGAHLHLEVREAGQLRDPLDFLAEANLDH